MTTYQHDKYQQNTFEEGLCMLVIDRKNPLPLYVQLKEIIIEKVENGDWKAGETIPTEMELIKQLGLSRTTVRQALSELVTSGVLERIQGKGTYVAGPKYEPKRPQLTSFTEDMKNLGYKVSSVVLNQEYIKVSPKLVRLFEINSEEEVLKLERIRNVDDLAIGFHEVYLNTSIANIALENYDFNHYSLYDALVKEGVVLGESEETIEASFADDFVARLLGISKGSPVLKMMRLTRLKDGRMFEYNKMVYRADKYKYTIKLNNKD